MLLQPIVTLAQRYPPQPTRCQRTAQQHVATAQVASSKPCLVAPDKMAQLLQLLVQLCSMCELLHQERWADYILSVERNEDASRPFPCHGCFSRVEHIDIEKMHAQTDRAHNKHLKSLTKGR